jgi:hypothetical protein
MSMVSVAVMVPWVVALASSVLAWALVVSAAVMVPLVLA